MKKSRETKIKGSKDQRKNQEIKGLKDQRIKEKNQSIKEPKEFKGHSGKQKEKAGEIARFSWFSAVAGNRRTRAYARSTLPERRQREQT